MLVTPANCDPAMVPAGRHDEDIKEAPVAPPVTVSVD